MANSHNFHHHNDGVNPLRPYYIPPSIGEPVDSLPTPGPRAFSHGPPTGKYATKARDIFSDIDYKDYLAEPSPSFVQNVKEMLDELMYKYTSVLMAQPFELAKTLMQVRAQDDLGGLAAAVVAAEESRQRQANQKMAMYDEGTIHQDHSDSEPDETSFFTTSQPRPSSPTLTRTSSRRARDEPQPSPTKSPGVTKPSTSTVAPHQLTIQTPNSVFEVIAQLWQKEGAWGVWKGSSATFFYSVLQSLVENWSRSFLSALLNVPDLGVRADTDRLVDIASPYPWASLCVAAAASVLTGLALAPLDLVRTRLIVTSTTSRASRRTLTLLRALPSYLCPGPLVVPTILHSLVHPLITLSTPLVLRTRFMIDREVAPIAFSLAKFFSSTAALFVRLPLETVLRRGQVAVLASPAYVRALEGTSAAPSASSKSGKKSAAASTPTSTSPEPSKELETIVPLGRYDGVFGTMYTIINEEGSRAVPVPTKTKRRRAAASKTPSVSETVYRRGQGVDGLWRGWKVSWWGLVGLWAAGVLGGGGDGEF